MEFDITNHEKQNLEAHVDLCAIRYQQLDTRLGKLEADVSEIKRDIMESHKSLKNTVITTSGTIVVALIGVLTAIFLKV
jgi:hypothetical protein